MRSGIAATIGFLIAPLISALVLAAYTLLADGSELTQGLLILPIYYSASACATLLLGVPVFLLLSRFNVVRWWSALLTGMVIGALAGIAVGTNSVGLLGLLVTAVAGTASGLTFWLIWRFGKERQAPIAR